MTTVVAAVMEKDGKTLICQRNESGPHPLKWEFPGGKVEAGESEVGALRRELCEELGIEAEIGPEIARYPYKYPGKDPILLTFFLVRNFQGAVTNRVFQRVVWAEPGTLTDFDILDGDLAFVREFTARARAES